jgi:hypothetical protein
MRDLNLRLDDERPGLEEARLFTLQLYACS